MRPRPRLRRLGVRRPAARASGAHRPRGGGAHDGHRQAGCRRPRRGHHLWRAAASQAIELDEATRTVAADPKTNVVLTVEQVKRGKRLFNSACATCHTGGITKTNPNVGLDTEALSFATPQRNTIVSLVDYMKDPTTYDGLESIAEIHPAVKSADIFPKMRALTEDDLTAIAGHILLQPAVVAEKWGGGKIYY